MLTYFSQSYGRYIILESFGRDFEGGSIVELVKMLFAIFSPERLPPNALTLRNNEYAADATALRITNNIRAAKSSLVRICNGDLSSASHLFDLAGKVMERRYQAYLRLRRKFI